AATTGDEVVRYSLLGEGKRLRPTLVFAAHEALNGASSAGVAELAAAVEVVHAYSLVHDDLPCMDNDDLRRGRPTAHRAFDVPRATRAGYEMVALAARILARGLAALALPPVRRREIALEVFRAGGEGGRPLAGCRVSFPHAGRARPLHRDEAQLILERMKGPADVQALPPEQLQQLADEVRQRLIDVVSQTGGHIGAGLGVVELTVA